VAITALCFAPRRRRLRNREEVAMPGLLGLVVGALAAVFLALPAERAAATHVGCGDTITQDTVLDSDLVDCPGQGIVIGAGGITLDLNGHTVDGDGEGCDTGVMNGRFVCGSDPLEGHDGVTVRGGTVREFAHGVQVAEAARNALLDLQLYDHSGYGGIVTYLMSDGRIERNRAFGNNSAGIALYEPIGRTTVEHNVVGRNAGFGIELWGGLAGDSFANNVAFANRVAGFFFFSAYGLPVKRNRSFGNRGAGMIFAGAVGNQIERNRMWDNESSGILMWGGVHENRLEKNVVIDNGFDGITLEEGDHNLLSGNRVVGNRGRGGIVIESADGGNIVASNRVSGNEGHGILIAPSYPAVDRTIVTGNHSVGNGQDGIQLSEGIQPSELRGNRTDRNGDDGIDVDSDEAALYANRARWNSDLGIEAVAGVLDGGGNSAFGNGNSLQCANVFCK
jgi:parallel beta-helix repeat protein